MSSRGMVRPPAPWLGGAASIGVIVAGWRGVSMVGRRVISLICAGWLPQDGVSVQERVSLESGVDPGGSAHRSPTGLLVDASTAASADGTEAYDTIIARLQQNPDN